MPSQLPLRSIYQDLGASFQKVGDWELPAQFSSLQEEYAAAQETAALADLSHLGKIRFRGPDRKKFLHGLVSNDVLNLSPQRGMPACLLSPKGRLLADMELLDLGEELLSLHQPRATPNILQAISKLLPLSRTEMTDVSREWGAFTLLGPQTNLLLENLTGPLPAPNPHLVIPTDWKGTELLLICEPRRIVSGWLILLPAQESEKFWGAVQEAGAPLGLRAIGWNTLNVIRLEAGIPLYGVDMDEESLPPEVRLEDALSETKGCYMGQETIAKIKNLGHLNRILTGLKLSGKEAPSPGSPILSQGREAGKITSAAYSPKFQSIIALAILRIEESSLGGRLKVRCSGKEQGAEVIPLPPQNS